MNSGIPVGEDINKLKKLITGDTTGIRRLQADLRHGEGLSAGASHNIT